MCDGLLGLVEKGRTNSILELQLVTRTSSPTPTLNSNKIIPFSNSNSKLELLNTTMDVQDFQYRNLIVWQKAMEFSRQTYRLIDQFPATEKYALSDQVRRAAVSVPSNIAEGCGRVSNRDYAHFLSIARGSLYETMTQLELAQSLGYIDTFKDVEELASEISRMLTSLIKRYNPFSNSNS